MFFDDRLATVLRHSAASEGGARTQFRQLLDILGNRKFVAQDDRERALVAAAWLRLEALADRIPAKERAAMIREPGWRFRSADLAAHLAESEPEVAAAALVQAKLSAEDWTALIPRLPVRARGFLRFRDDLPEVAEALLDRLGVSDRGLPAPEKVEDQSETAIPTTPSRTPQTAEDATAAPSSASGASGAPPQPRVRVDEADARESGRSEISALVERIARFRRSRDDTAPAEADRSPALPLGLPPDEGSGSAARKVRNFGFIAGPTGRIDWAEGKVAPMVIGTRLSGPGSAENEAFANAIDRAFAGRLPIEGAVFALEGAPAISGNWIVDARPRFTEAGNFAGYLGRFRRSVTDLEDPSSPAAREADRIRQLLHELRTPVTAIQGYAEVIQQQLFGPAPHEYRALAAAIAADAARILAGFDELDRLAKLETGAIEIESGEADLAEIARAIAGQLERVFDARMAGIHFDQEDEVAAVVALDPDEAEALLWRLLATLGSNCASGEILDATIEVDKREVRISCELPAKLMAQEDVFAADIRPTDSAVNAGLFGAGFALRLARAEARAAGGRLDVGEEGLVLALPLLTDNGVLPSADGTARANNPAA